MPRHAALARRNQRQGRRLLPGAEAACTDPLARADSIVTALLSHDARPARGKGGEASISCASKDPTTSRQGPCPRLASRVDTCTSGRAGAAWAGGGLHG